MHYALFGLIIALAGMAPAVQAQVFKCTGPGGKPTFSDRPCDTGSTGGLVQRERTFEEKMSERGQAYEAEARKQNRRMAEQVRDWAAQSQRPAQPMAAPVVRHSGNDWAKRKELQNLETSASSITTDGSRWDKPAEARRDEARREEARKRAAHAGPTTFTNCAPGFCYDNQGGVYHRVSPDFMTGPNGRACHRSGNMWNCS